MAGSRGSVSLVADDGAGEPVGFGAGIGVGAEGGVGGVDGDGEQGIFGDADLDCAGAAVDCRVAVHVGGVEFMLRYWCTMAARRLGDGSNASDGPRLSCAPGEL